METVAITRTINETKNIKTIRFKWRARPRPGQFLMAWVPGVDEVPMSISYSGEEAGFTVLAVGEATRALLALEPGDRIGVKGPLGNSFRLSGKRILAVGGGSGTAGIALAAEAALEDGREVACAIGARTAADLLFEKRLAKAGADVRVSTDDGSGGRKGFATQLAAEMVSEEKPDLIIACGPEPMLRAVADLALKNKIKCQCSLERYMKCGIGLCGSCTCGKYTVCADGPVFDAKVLAGIPDFGKFKRDKGGRIVRL